MRIIIVLLITLFLADSPVFSAARPITTGTVTASALYLRQGPSKYRYAPVAALPLMRRGLRVKLLEYADNGWGKIEATQDGATAVGYCSLSYVRLDSYNPPDDNAAPPASDNNTPATPAFGTTNPPTTPAAPLPSGNKIRITINPDSTDTKEEFNMPIASYMANAGETVNVRLDFNSVSRVQLNAASLSLIINDNSGFSADTATHTYTASGSNPSISLATNAPANPGFYKLRINMDGEEAVLNIITLVPFQRASYIENYRMGTYPSSISVKGFIKVRNDDDMYTKLSPHFSVSEFVSRQQQYSYPKFFYITPRIIRKLELIRERINNSSISVNSAYRTPWHNGVVGGASLSEHMQGNATDFYTPGYSLSSAWRIIDNIDRSRDTREFVGGGKNYGGFIHTDTRGRADRW